MMCFRAGIYFVDSQGTVAAVVPLVPVLHCGLLPALPAFLSLAVDHA